VIRAHAFDTLQHQSLSLISSNPDHSVISAIIIYILLFFIILGPEWSIKKLLLTIYQITQTKIFIHRIHVQESCSLNYKSVFLLPSLGLYLCWCTINFRGYNPPCNRCFCTDMIYLIHFYPAMSTLVSK